MDVDFSGKTSLTSESGVLCLYCCCPTCLEILYSLTPKILIHKWGSNRSLWIVEDAHDVVASVSVDVLAVVRRMNVCGGFNNSLDDKLRDGNSERFEWLEIITCHCQTSGNKSLLPVECKCHTISDSTITNKQMLSEYSSPFE
ncbi:unnamed protein product [Prunus brigantina]